MRRLVLLLVALLVCLPGRVDAAPRWVKQVALSFSLGCEAGDLGTSMYVFGQERATEQNPALKRWQDRPIPFTAAKVGLSIPPHVIAAELFDRGRPWWAVGIWAGNGVFKCWQASRNDRLRRVP